METSTRVAFYSGEVLRSIWRRKLLPKLLNLSAVEGKIRLASLLRLLVKYTGKILFISCLFVYLFELTMRRVKHVGEFAVAFNFDLVKFLLKYQAYFVERSFKNHRICLTLLMFYFRWSCLRVKTRLNVDESCVQNIQCHATSKIPQIMSPLKEARLDKLVNKQVIIVFVLCIYTTYIST